MISRRAFLSTLASLPIIGTFFKADGAALAGVDNGPCLVPAPREVRGGLVFHPVSTIYTMCVCGATFDYHGENAAEKACAWHDEHDCPERKHYQILDAKVFTCIEG